jgi:hypothetical protein
VCVSRVPLSPHGVKLHLQRHISGAHDWMEDEGYLVDDETGGHEYFCVDEVTLDVYCTDIFLAAVVPPPMWWPLSFCRKLWSWPARLTHLCWLFSFTARYSEGGKREERGMTLGMMVCEGQMYLSVNLIHL